MSAQPDAAPDLSTRYLGMELRSPLVASASPLTGTIDGLRSLQRAGAGAVVLPSLFAEQLSLESMEIDRVLSLGAESTAEAASFFPEMRDYNTGPTEYLRLVARAKRELSIPVIASLNGTDVGGWVEHAALLEEAGADALELNIYEVAADPERSGADIERRALELIAAVRAAVGLPLAVKIGPFFSSVSHLAGEMASAGADGLVLFNRFYQPDLDLEHLDVLPRLVLSTSDELRLPLRWIAILYGHVAASLACTTGIHTSEDALKALLAGADVAMMTSALLRHGPAHLRKVQDGMVRWLVEREYESVAQLRGSVSRRAVPDPEAYERANYMRVLSSYRLGPV